MFLAGEFHGQRSLADYSPWGRKESDTAERLTYAHLSVPGLACMWDLVPWPGIEPWPPVLGAQSLNHWDTREISPWLFLKMHFSWWENEFWISLLRLIPEISLENLPFSCKKCSFPESLQLPTPSGSAPDLILSLLPSPDDTAKGTRSSDQCGIPSWLIFASKFHTALARAWSDLVWVWGSFCPVRLPSHSGVRVVLSL